jgi:hypothetical protein
MSDTAIALSQRIPIRQSESSAVINLIERAARDPSVDLDKLAKLIELRDRMEAKDAERAFDDAMAQVQSQMRPIAADCDNSQTRSRYASYAALDRVLRPIYTAAGFTLSFNTGDAPLESYVRILCRVSHGGCSREHHIDMPADGKGAKGGDVMTKTHATGSAISYGMRYLLKMIFNISVGDDDGNGAGDIGPVISQVQLQQLISLADEVGADKIRLCKYLKIEALAHLPASRFTQAMDALKSKRKNHD